MHDRIDMRSDAITKPSADMRRAIAEAEVGDDVMGDDPTVARLEAKVAAMLGKPAALFFPSGTMSNQTAIQVQTNPGDEIVCDVGAHLYNYESGAPAVISGVSICAIEGHHGALSGPQVKKRLRPVTMHQPRTALICLENTHNRAGGRIYPPEMMREVAAVARENRLRVHLDGARLFNAALARGLPVTEWTAHADTVNVCMSKGLGAPIGSLLAGDADTIDRARWTRKRLGGGMRQVGILAAAALYALDKNITRLADDHANARRLALGLADLPGLDVRPAETETNIVLVRVTDECKYSVPELLALLAEWNVHLVPFGEGTMRAVTHLDVDGDDVEKAIEVFTRLLKV